MSSNTTERSQSRGREPVYSSGRGGAGNIRPASGSREHPARQPGPDDFSPARGRELTDRREEVTTTGRGGAGNLRSPSREARVTVEDAIRLDRQYTRDREARQPEQIFSTGRGGVGNMSRSRSRSRDPSLPISPSGPSPAVRGSLADGRPSFELSKLEEEDKKIVEHDETVQLPTGRATAGHAPVRELQHLQHDSQGFSASGRGGAGNIHAATVVY